MADLKRFNDLKRQIEQKQQEADRAEGALEQLKGKLKEDFGCPTLQKAEEKLNEMLSQKEKIEREFEKALQEFDKKWGYSNTNNDKEDDDDDDD